MLIENREHSIFDINSNFKGFNYGIRSLVESGLMSGSSMIQKIVNNTDVKYYIAALIVPVVALKSISMR